MLNSKKIVRTGPYKNKIASGVKAGGLIFLSGQVSVDSRGNTVGAGDICEQLQQTYFNLKDVLDEFGAAPDLIIDETWFVTNIGDAVKNFESLVAIREIVLGASLRDISHTLVQISGLADPELLIEVKCIAQT